MKYLPYAILAVILAFVFISRSQFYEVAMERDEGIYIYIGHLILDGKIPYVDFYETRFPGIFYMYALLVAIFGYSAKGVAVGVMLMVVATTALLFYTGKRMFGTAAGLIGAAAFGLLSMASTISGFTRQSEHMVNFWTVLGVWLMLRAMAAERRQALWYMGSGVAMCIALLIKPNAVYLIPALGLLMVGWAYFEEKLAWKTIIMNGVWYSMGVFGMFGVMYAGMVAIGAGNAFYEFAIVEAGKYAEGFSFEEGWPLFTGTYNALDKDYGALMWAAYIALALSWLSSLELWKKIGLSLLFVAGFWTVTPGLRFYGHYWLIWMPFMALAIGALPKVLEMFFAQYLPSLTTAAKFSPVLMILLLLFNLIKQQQYYFRPNLTAVVRNTYGDNPFNPIKRVGDFLKKRVKPEDKLALIGSEPQLYVYTGLDSPTRHAYFTYLMLDTTKTPRIFDWQREFKEDLVRENPKYMVFTSHAISVYANKNSDMRIFDWLTQHIQNNYNRIGCVEIPPNNDYKYYLTDAEVKGMVPKTQFFIDVYEHK
ncbi:MAG: glycosyltransferase family 39 protein [Saprospiraceae bacterium]|nr:glycosyltransferase family 39 protein [Saprospiraceae bacterium]